MMKLHHEGGRGKRVIGLRRTDFAVDGAHPPIRRDPRPDFVFLFFFIVQFFFFPQIVEA